MIHRILLPVALLPMLAMAACNDAMSAGNRPPDLSEQHAGKVFLPGIGVHVTVPDDLVRGKEANAFRSREGDLTVLITCEADAQASVQRLAEGVTVGNSTLVATGDLEQLGAGRFGLMTVQRDNADGSILQYRYVIYADRIPKGTLMAIAVIVQPDEALFARAKARALEVLDGVEVLSEEDIAAERAGRVAAIRSRERTPEEARMRQLLMGHALYRSSNSSGGSGTTYAYSTFYERFQLCPSGEGSHISESRVQVGDYEGSSAGPNVERATGVWDITRNDRGHQLELHEADGNNSSWDIAITDEGEVVLGGKRFRLLSPGDEGGPDCP